MFANEHTNNPRARQFRRIKKAVDRSQGGADKIASAQSKRERKALKRLADSSTSAFGEMLAREKIDGIVRTAVDMKLTSP